MTLDSAITYYEEIAKECRRKADIERNDYMDMMDSASEAEHLASWLNELKLLRGRIDAQPERKKGKWEIAYLDHVSIGTRPKVLYCSECNQCIAYPTNYCPNCGADMRGEQE